MSRADAALLLIVCAIWTGSCSAFPCRCPQADPPFDGGAFVVTSEPDPGSSDTAVRTEEGRSTNDLVLEGSLLEVTPERVVLESRAVDGSEVRLEWAVTSRTLH